MDSKELVKKCIEQKQHLDLLSKESISNEQKNENSNKANKRKRVNFLSNLWNNSGIMFVISVIIFITACIFLFRNDRFMFITMLAVSEGAAIYIAYRILSEMDGKTIDGKIIFLATIIALVFSILLFLICGIELYPSYSNCPYCGGKGYFGGGKYGPMVDCPSC